MIIVLVDADGEEVGQVALSEGQVEYIDKAQEFSDLTIEADPKDEQAWGQEFAEHFRTPYLRVLLDQ